MFSRLYQKTSAMHYSQFIKNPNSVNEQRRNITGSAEIAEFPGVAIVSIVPIY